jgi:GAF domain-containing protein
VVPIVRAHHEKWDGTGYPYGLAGEAIPIGARILAAVDCFDALASDRQYRKALPLDEAMAKVVADAGKAFDPQVVEILQRRYLELEKLASEQTPDAPAKLSTDVKVERGSAPAAGFAKSEEPETLTAAQDADLSTLVSAARNAAMEIVELKKRSPTLRLEDVFSLTAIRLRQLVPYDALAAYCLQEELLVPVFVSGENFNLFSNLQIPLGEGLSGWVAQNHKAILNGNPSVEPGYLNDTKKYSTLRSALAVPLEGSLGLTAVLALYRGGQDAFTADNLRILEALAEAIAPAIETLTMHKVNAAAAASS